ncbi:MAG TPA: UvrB/UvrC motif-containing protein [Gemmataceae bacterium]|nr:UvrB/UvrC motif-containing protein [Gemmataceae bacterium]
MSELFGKQPFQGFGPDHLRLDSENPPVEGIAATKRSELRQRVWQVCPPRPGVYGMLDRHGDLIYIGKAKSLRARVLSYFRKGNRTEKACRIIRQTRTVIWEPATSEFAALVRELELIYRWQPRFNVLGIPDRDRWVYLCLGKKPAAFAYVTRKPNGKEVAAFGPLKGMRMTKEAARRINDLFQLRDCSREQIMRFADQQELFPVLQAAGCLRYELGTCLGPCARYTTQATYSRHVRQAREFLQGSDLAPLRRLEDEMMAAAELQQYERAAALRDRVQALLWLQERLNGLVRAREQLSFVYPVRSVDGEELWYLIHRARVLRVIPAPASERARNAALRWLEKTYFQSETMQNPFAKHPVDHVLLVLRWFRRRADERQRSLSPETARALCRQETAVRALNSPL